MTLPAVDCTTVSDWPDGSNAPPLTELSRCSVISLCSLFEMPPPLGVHFSGFCLPGFSDTNSTSILLDILFVVSPLVPPVLSAWAFTTTPPLTSTGAGPQLNSARFSPT